MSVPLLDSLVRFEILHVDWKTTLKPRLRRRNSFLVPDVPGGRTGVGAYHTTFAFCKQNIFWPSEHNKNHYHFRPLIAVRRPSAFKKLNRKANTHKSNQEKQFPLEGDKGGVFPPCPPRGGLTCAHGTG